MAGASSDDGAEERTKPHGIRHHAPVVPPPRVLVLGCGHAGRVIALRAREAGRVVRVTTRSLERARALGAEDLDVVRTGELGPSIAEEVDEETHVVVAFPPDGAAEHVVADAVRRAGAVTWLSTTGVYALDAGRVDETTAPAPPASDRARRLLDAERSFLDVGGTVLRCPGIYGPDRGLHVRVVRGEHKIPGDGSRHLSRIHVEDLAALVLASSSAPGRTFVVGDLTPAPHVEVVRWICEAYGVPLPPSVPLDQVHVSLRGDRRVDPSAALSALGVTLRFPSFQLGMAPSATGLVAGADRR